jgi:hypothetical protein
MKVKPAAGRAVRHPIQGGFRSSYGVRALLMWAATNRLTDPVAA